MTVSPFKFLDSYTKEDQSIFFGRDKEIEELYSKIFESKILLVYGVSGTGKTSIINCGLSNKFHDSDWLPVQVRRGSDINESLRNELQKAALTTIQIKPQKLKKGVQSIYLDHFKPIYFIFDQLEEIFIFGSKEERTEFIKCIKELIESDIQCKFLFVIREEYLANITEFEEEIPQILSNRIRIEKMNRQQAKEVVEGPCSVAGIKLEDGFTEKLLGNLNPDSSEIELTYLQIFLDKFYKQSDEIFTIKQIEAAGKVGDVLGDFLEEQIRQFEDPDIGLKILKAFVSVKGTKRQINIEEAQDTIRTLGSDVNEEILQNHIQQFVNLRILRDKDDNNRYELRHDSLAQKIFEKITLVEKELFEVRQFIENAYSNYQKRKIVLNREDIEYLEKFESSLLLSGELKDFVDKSKQEDKKQKKTAKAIVAISAIVLIVVLAILGYYASLKINSSQSEAIANQMLNTVNSPEFNFVVSKDEFSKHPNWVTEKAVLVSFYNLVEANGKDSNRVWAGFTKNYNYKFPKYNDEVVYATFTEDSKLIYGYLANHQIKVWNLKGEEIGSFDSLNKQIVDLKMSPDNQLLSVVFIDSSGLLYNLKSKKYLEFLTAYNYRNPKQSTCFSGSSKFYILKNIQEIRKLSFENQNNKVVKSDLEHIMAFSVSNDEEFMAIVDESGQIELLRLDGNKSEYYRFSQFKCHKDTIWSVQFSKNNRYLLTSSADSTACIWNFYGKKIRDVDDFYFFWKYGKELQYNSGYRLSPICNAEFSENESTVILSRYSLPDSIPLKKYGASIVAEYSHYEKLSKNRCYQTAATELRHRNAFEYLYYSAQVNNYFNKLTFSKNDSYVAIVINDNNYSTLIYTKGYYKLLDIKGINPEFSTDGKFLLTLVDNTINLKLISIDEIINIDGMGKE